MTDDPDNKTKLEQRAFGCVLLDPALFSQICQALQWYSWSIPEHRALFTLMQTLHNFEVPLDVLSVTRHLDAARGDPPEEYVVSLATIVANPRREWLDIHWEMHRLEPLRHD